MVGTAQRSDHIHDLDVVVEQGRIMPVETCKGPHYSSEITIRI
jgi:hypothetical protein